MRQIAELDIDRIKKAQDVIRILKRKKISDPHHVSLSLSHKKEITEIQKFTFLVYLEAAFEVLDKKLPLEELDSFVVRSLGKATSNSFTVGNFESELEALWQSQIEWQLSAREKEEDPLDGLFGLWENKNITIESIRKKAWPKRT